MPASPLRELFLNHNAQTSDNPLLLEFTSASGLYLTAPDGKKYADLISGIGVSNVGHSHPAVVKAVQDQAAAYMHLMVYGEYIQGPQVHYATELARLLPLHLRSVYFVNSGSEAIEGAMKLAKRVTGRTEIVAARNGYHGSTQGAMSLMSDEERKNPFRPLLPAIRLIDFNDESDLTHITEKTACVILETIQGEAGVYVPEEPYLEAVQKRCRETGALLVLDEIQCGFGRTGRFFAFQHYQVEPDILVIGKAIGGGMPLGAFISSPEYMSALRSKPALGHITTFGGHPVSCAAGRAALKVLQDDNLIEQVAAKEQLFRKYLAHPSIKAVRGKGLLLALEFENAGMVQQIIASALEQGVITDWFLHNDKSLRIAPPLTITEKEIEEVCCKIFASIDRIIFK